MSDPTLKIVNGIRVELNSDEISHFKTEWAKEDEKRSARMILKEQKKMAKASLKSKLNALGLSEEEVNLLKM
jgi:hypothetical protein